MTPPNRYLQLASECLRIAERTSVLNDKMLLLEMAEAWRQLAERSARWRHGARVAMRRRENRLMLLGRAPCVRAHCSTPAGKNARRRPRVPYPGKRSPGRRFPCGISTRWIGLVPPI